MLSSAVAKPPGCKMTLALSPGGGVTTTKIGVVACGPGSLTLTILKDETNESLYTLFTLFEPEKVTPYSKTMMATHKPSLNT